MTAIPALESRLATLRAELSAALVEGDDTAEIRERITSAEVELTAARRTAAEAKAAQVAQEVAVVAAAGDALADAEQAAVEAAATLPAVDGVDLPAIERTPEIEDAARRVAQARAALERAEADHRPLVAQAERLAGRLAEKRTALEALRSRRLAGDEREGDAAEAALLQADSEALQLLVGDARIKASAAAPAAQQAALRAAELNLERVRAEAIYQQALRQVRAIEAALFAGVDRLVLTGAVVGKRTQRQAYEPDQRLFALLRGV